MATYSFNTITEGEALSFDVTDSLTFLGSAVSVTVIYVDESTIGITLGRTVLFNSQVITAAQAGLLTFTDGSLLYIGDDASNTKIVDSLTRSALFGGAGNDTLSLGQTGGLIQGNQGNDSLTAGGQSTIYGGQDNDTLAAGVGAQNDFLQGNKGDDSLVGGSASDTLLGGQGNDTISGNQGLDFINGNLGDDIITGSGQLFGEDGADIITAISSTGPGGVLSVISGGDGADVLTSNNTLSDTVMGGVGNDTIVSNVGGPDSLDGGDGADNITANVLATISGGEGADTIRANFSGSVVDGGANNDTVTTGSLTSVTINGGVGNDNLSALGAGASVDGGDGDDRLFIQSGTANGGLGSDTVGDLSGGFSLLNGGDGNDLLGGAGSSTIFGGLGNDTIDAGLGADVMTGGQGADTFVISAGSSPITGPVDQVLDWEVADKIHVNGYGGGSLGYIETTSTSFAAAVTEVGILSSPSTVIVVQIGADLAVFSGPTGGGANPTQALLLVGRTLADIDATNITA